MNGTMKTLHLSIVTVIGISAAIIFSLFILPSLTEQIKGFRGGLPVSFCGGRYYWSDANFKDGSHELLSIFVNSPSCRNSNPIFLSTHTNPQAGLTFYDGKMTLLVSK